MRPQQLPCMTMQPLTLSSSSHKVWPGHDRDAMYSVSAASHCVYVPRAAAPAHTSSTHLLQHAVAEEARRVPVPLLPLPSDGDDDDTPRKRARAWDASRSYE